MEWRVLIVREPNGATGVDLPGISEFPFVALVARTLILEAMIRIVVTADLLHACRCFATPTSPLDRSSDWRPRLLHGIASQFSRHRAIFRLGMEVATLRLRDDADTPSTSTSTRPPNWRSLRNSLPA